MDPAGRYRYRLDVQLAGAASGAPTLAVIQKNPSTATAQRSDPTVGKVEAWASRRGFGAVHYVNLFALRATDPRALNAVAAEEAIGPANDATLRAVLASDATVVIAWGNPNGIARSRYDQRIAAVLALAAGRVLHQVGTPTQQGYPRHGLLWNGNPPLLPVAPQWPQF